MRTRPTKEKDKENRLFLAAMAGNSHTLKNLLAEKANPNAETTTNKDTLLMWAAYNGHTECVKILIEAKANIDAKNNDGNTALMQAIWLYHTPCIELLIKTGANLNIQNKINHSAIMDATDKGYLTCVEMLIAAKADLNLQNQYQYTALILGANKFHSSCVAALVVAGAKLSSKEIDKPKKLLELLIETDIRNPKATLAIDKLLKEHKNTLTTTEFKKFEENLIKRIQLFTLHKKNVYLAFDKGMSIHMPIELLDLITQYEPIINITTHNHFHFFSLRDCDAIIEEEKEIEKTLLSCE